MVTRQHNSSIVRRWHAVLCRSWFCRAFFFILSFALFSGWLVLLNSPHLGVNASLHWDAEESIVAGPAVGSREVLENGRRHLYDVLPLVHSDDPLTITTFFWSPRGLAYHDGLTQCRYYYSFVSDYVGHQTLLLGKRWFGTPVGAVICYQLSATAVVALGLSAMFLWVVVRLRSGHRLAIRMLLVVLTFAAISSSPVMLSIARQMLTETCGFAGLVATVVCVAGMIKQRETPGLRYPEDPGLRSTSGTGVFRGFLFAIWKLLLAILAGAFCFLTIRSRYTLGPALAMLLPLIVLLRVPIARLEGVALLCSTGVSPVPSDSRHGRDARATKWGRGFIFVAINFVISFSVLAALDYHRFGPFFFPWVYDQVMVRSSKLMFHADPPYDDFILAVFVNLPLLVIPLIGVWCWIDHRDIGDRAVSSLQERFAKVFAAAVFVVLTVMLWRTAAQQVKFQGRHLFAISATATMLLLIVLPRIQWRPAAAGAYFTLTGFFLVWNCYSTFGPQRKHALQYQPDFVTVLTRHLSTAGATAKKSLARDVWNSYFDWADDRVVHDSLLTWDYVDQHRQGGALVLLDSAAPKANQLEFYARMFPNFQVCEMHDRTDPVALSAAQAAITRGQSVYLFTVPGPQLTNDPITTSPISDLHLYSNTLRRVVQVSSK